MTKNAQPIYKRPLDESIRFQNTPDPEVITSLFSWIHAIGKTASCQTCKVRANWLCASPLRYSSN